MRTNPTEARIAAVVVGDGANSANHTPAGRQDRILRLRLGAGGVWERAAADSCDYYRPCIESC